LYFLFLSTKQEAEEDEIQIELLNFTVIAKEKFLFIA